MIPQALRFRDRLLANTRPRIVETRDHVCAGPPQRGLMCFTKKAFMLPFRKRQFARLIVVNKATAKKPEYWSTKAQWMPTQRLLGAKVT